MMDDNTIKSEIAESWNQESAFYDTHVSHGVQTAEEKTLWTAAFLSVLPAGEQLRILDVGCGTGAMGLILAEMGHTVTGIDLSEGMMAVGRQKAEAAGLSMTFETGDAENPPFAAETFDVVINRHLLWTLPHPDAALSAWYRVLKPEGVVMIVDGVWNDGKRISRMRRDLSAGLSRLIESHPHAEKGYSSDLQNSLPNNGGVSEDAARRYLEQAGFLRITAQNLAAIRKNQRKRLNWYQKINPVSTYYLISGTKEGNPGQ